MLHNWCLDSTVAVLHVWTQCLQAQVSEGTADRTVDFVVESAWQGCSWTEDKRSIS